MTQFTSQEKDTIEKFINISSLISETKEKMKELEEIKEVYEESILSIFQDNDTYTDNNGSVIKISTRRSYKEWPSDIQVKEEELKELKAQAKRVGNVEYEIIRSVTCKSSD